MTRAVVDRLFALARELGTASKTMQPGSREWDAAEQAAVDVARVGLMLEKAFRLGEAPVIMQEGEERA
jgi:hypothetical protein